MISIDGQNIKTTWTLTPVFDGLYKQLMKFPALKPRDTQDWCDKDGLDVNMTDPVYAHREMTFNFFCDTYAVYKSFIAYLKAHQNVLLFDSYTDRTYTLEYLDCSEFNYHRNYSIFAIRVRECDTTTRVDSYLLQENGFELLTESGIGILIQ